VQNLLGPQIQQMSSVDCGLILDEDVPLRVRLRSGFGTLVYLGVSRRSIHDIEFGIEYAKG